MGQNPKHCAVQADQNRHPEALVGVSRAECHGSKENAGGCAPSQGYALPLQITPKDRLLADTRRNRERYPDGYFDTPMREDEIHTGTVLGNAQEPAQDKKEARRNDPERRSHSNIPKPLAGGLPTMSENKVDRRATAPHAHHYKDKQEPFKLKGEHIEAKTVRIHRCPHVVRDHPSQEGPRAQYRERKNRVEWASGLAVTAGGGWSLGRNLHEYLSSG